MSQLFPTLLEVAATVLIALIGLTGTWLTVKIGKTKNLERTQKAMDALVERATYTVLALKQTLVDDWKAASKDGKLTAAQRTTLQDKLVGMTIDALSPDAYEVLKAASLDITQIIIDTGEAVLAEIKLESESGVSLALPMEVTIEETTYNEPDNADITG